jgi:hypothetical protein
MAQLHRKAGSRECTSAAAFVAEVPSDSVADYIVVTSGTDGRCHLATTFTDPGHLIAMLAGIVCEITHDLIGITGHDAPG